jgi:hypothetical protein
MSCERPLVLRLTFLAAVAVRVLLGREASAQATVGVTVGGSSQAAGKSDRPYLGPPFGGTSRAIVGNVDLPIGRNACVGGEISLAGDISGVQSQRALNGNNTVVSTHHDSVFSGVFKLTTPRGIPVRVATVFGAGLAHRHTHRTGTFLGTFPPFERRPVDYVVADLAITATVGADVSVRVTEHVGVLAVGRIHRILDDDRDFGAVKRGVSSTIARYGGGMQVRF